MAEPTLIERLGGIKQRARNARGAIESNQVVDKDVHGSMDWIIEQCDAALERHSLPGGAEAYIVQRADGESAETRVVPAPPPVWMDTAIATVRKHIELTKEIYPVGEVRGVALSALESVIGDLRKLPGSPGWRDIDTAPKDGTNILVATGAIVREAYWMPDYYGDEEGACWMPANTDEEYGHELHPTHWQPLPPPPQQEGK